MNGVSNKMMSISLKDAIDLLKSNSNIYMIYDDNTKKKAQSVDDLITHHKYGLTFVAVDNERQAIRKFKNALGLCGAVSIIALITLYSFYIAFTQLL